MHLLLPPGFGFLEFKEAIPLGPAHILPLIVERHADRIRVKRHKPALENLERIFESTFRLANQRGFAAMSLRDLCHDTGLSMGGLYGYIASKDDLAAMIQDVVHYVGSALPTWFSEHSTPLNQMDSILRGHIFMSELLHPWFYFVFMESRMLSASNKAVARTAELELQQELARLCVKARLATEPESLTYAAHFQALIQDWYVKRWKYRQQHVSVDAFADSVSRFVLESAKATD